MSVLGKIARWFRDSDDDDREWVSPDGMGDFITYEDVEDVPEGQREIAERLIEMKERWDADRVKLRPRYDDGEFDIVLTKKIPKKGEPEANAR